MNKFKVAIMLIVALAASTAFAAGLPSHCAAEITALSKGSSFDMQKFSTDLPPAVAKAKLQAKAPFGKPKDSDKTDIGITFGCLKAFPESPAEIQSLLKDVSQDMAKGAVTSQLQATGQAVAQEQGAQPAAPPLPPPPPPQARHQYPPPPPPQAQHQYPPPPPPPQAQQQYPQQVQYFYAPQAPQACPQSDNFSAGQRWGTWALNIIPGLGSAVIMNDWAGMGIQLGLTALGVTSIIVFEDAAPLGFAILGVNFIFNIARSNSYNKPSSNIASKEFSGFNLAVRSSRRSGEMMPYFTYSKAF